MRIITLLFFLIVAGCKPPVTEQAAPFQLTDEMMARCEFSEVQVRDVKDELRLFGKIAADNNKLAHVYPIAGGNVTRINVELGDLVKQGTVLATVQSSEVADFQRQRFDALADVALAEKNVQVAKELFEGKLNSERDVIASERELAKANAELKRINEVYSIYKLGNESSYNIIAPISGFIVSKDINQNEQLRSDKGDMVFSIAQIDEIWVLANVNESNISKVSLGYEADVQTISYPDKIFKGKIDRIFNAIDPSTKAMKVLIKIPNPGLLLKPEMNATVVIHFSENRQMTSIPSSAVIFEKSKYWVMVFKSRSEIEARQIEVYRELGGITYVTSGLAPGERVISKNGLLIFDALND
ncbi:MAG: efflux RND transporter periplasmic adaptor subunit [Cytophagales bacterium]|nr:efflux RND transporter periplasmic adaptor subunit [Cytophagales bacterium]